MKRLFIASLLITGMLVAENALAQVRVVVRNAPPPRVVYVAPRPVPPPPARVLVVQPAPVRYVHSAPVVVVRERRHHRHCYRRR